MPRLPELRVLAEKVIQREPLLDSLQVGNPGSCDDERFRRPVERWKWVTLGILPEIYILRGAIDSISQHYFDGQQSLFPTVAEGFDQLVALVEIGRHLQRRLGRGHRAPGTGNRT